MAAEALLREGVAVDIYDAMPSFGRKFLMAGKSGLNITHTEEKNLFLSRYPKADPRLLQIVEEFDASDIINWMKDLGIESHTGSSGRVFPSMMKASPLLRAWLSRLSELGAAFFLRHRWQGWSDDTLVFHSPNETKLIKADVIILAMGGASWRRLGADGGWAEPLSQKGVPVAPFHPSNCGFTVAWSEKIKSEFAGAPVKSTKLSYGDQSSRAEFVITKTGVESGSIYSLSAPLRDAILKNGDAIAQLDLFPDQSLETLTEKLGHGRGKQSLSNHLRKTLGLKGARLALVYEFTTPKNRETPADLAHALKNLPLPLTGMAPLDEAISTIGGVTWEALDDTLMIKNMPGIFCAGEMIDWDAPTGGYLITACLATGKAAGLGAASYLKRGQKGAAAT